MGLESPLPVFKMTEEIKLTEREKERAKGFIIIVNEKNKAIRIDDEIAIFRPKSLAYLFIDSLVEYKRITKKKADKLSLVEIA